MSHVKLEAPLSTFPPSTDQYDAKWLDTSGLKQNLRTRSVKGSIITVLGQVTQFLLSAGSNLLLARMLAPEQFGLVAMVTAVTGFVTIFSDLGVSAAIVQKEKVSQTQVSAVFWINLFISAAIALLVTLAAPVLVSFYGEERLYPITLAFAASIFLTGLSVQHNALMKRQMRFKTLSLLQTTATGVSLIVGLLLARLGYGYWAIVAINVLTPVCTTFALWIVCDWRPSFSFRATEMSAILKFGMGVTGFDVVNYFARNADNILIGRVVGPAGLGLYSKAYQLLMLPINQLRNPLNTVALPALSNLQNDPNAFARYFSRYVFALAFFSMPVVMYLGVFSEEIVFLVLGKNWAAAGLIFKILAIPAFTQAIAGAQGLVLISTGAVKRYFRIGVFNSAAIILSFVVGVQWGVRGVAVAYAIVTYLVFFPSLRYCFAKSPVKLGVFLKDISLPAFYSFVSGAVMYLVKSYDPTLPPFLSATTGLGAGVVIYLGSWMLHPVSRRKMQDLLQLFQSLQKSKG